MSQQIISVLLRATGAQAFASQMNTIASSALSTQRAVQSVQNTIGMVKAAVAGAVGGFTLDAVANLGQQFENTQNKMAGFLNALGYAENYNDALQVSSSLMKKIELSAAALPGEAEDYVRVFTTALPQIEKSLGGTLDQMVGFSNQMAAVGATFGIDSMQVAHDMMRMLQVGRGGAGLDVRTFTEMLPFLQKVEGYANLTTESFNKLNEQARAQLLKKAVAQLGPMIDNAQNSFDALKGTAIATAKTMMRMATSPLFDGMKRGLAAVSSSFMDSDGNLTKLGASVVTVGKMFSTGLVGAVEGVANSISWVIANFDQLYRRVSNVVMPIFETKIDMVVRALPSLGAGLDVLVAAVVPLGQALLQLHHVVQPLSDAVLGIVLAAMPPLMSGLAGFAETLTTFIPWFSQMLGNALGWIVPPLIAVGGAIGRLVAAIVHFAGPILGILVGGVLKIVEYVSPVVGFLLDRLAAFGNGLAEILQYLGDKLREYLGIDLGGPKRSGASKGIAEGAKGLAEFLDSFKTGTAWAQVALAGSAPLDATKKKGPKVQTPAARGGTKVHQDFRNSRFTIDQKFEEGFDPDRVGVAFTQAVRKVGENKLQSGFEPLFGL